MHTSAIKAAAALLSAALLTACGNSSAVGSRLLPPAPETLDFTTGPTPLRAYSEKLLAKFTGGTSDGAHPVAGLIADASGALYGTTLLGGKYRFCFGTGCGTVFKLAPSRRGYQKSILWNFGGAGDGVGPSAGLIAVGSGTLYGTTGLGGAYGAGTVFKLTPSASGYTEEVLWSFNATDGSGPNGLTADSNGALYGTTIEGGANGDAGIVFKLMPSTNGYKEQVLWEFGGRNDGNAPDAGVVLDKAGAIYSTTGAGGNQRCSCGTVFKLTPSKTGYTERILWNFSDKRDDGAGPSGLIADASGALYGTTVEGGSGRCLNFGRTGCGTVYKLIPSRKGYRKKLLWSFGNFPGDGAAPISNLILDAEGSLYSTTAGGGRYQKSACNYLLGSPGCGTVFRLSPAKNGYSERVLWNFGAYAADGTEPEAGLIEGPRRSLYGTTTDGGGADCNCGTVFKLRN